MEGGGNTEVSIQLLRSRKYYVGPSKSWRQEKEEKDNNDKEEREGFLQAHPQFACPHTLWGVPLGRWRGVHGSSGPCGREVACCLPLGRGVRGLIWRRQEYSGLFLELEM